MTDDLSDGRDAAMLPMMKSLMTLLGKRHENEEPYVPGYEETAFDEDAVYFGGDDDPNDDLEGFEDDPSQLAEAYDSAYATYVDARQRFNQLKLARSYLPAVALTDGQTSTSPTSSTSTGKGRKKRPWERQGQAQGQGIKCDPVSTLLWWQERSQGPSESQHDLPSLWTGGPLGGQLPSEPQRKFITEQQEASTKLHDQGRNGPAG